MSSNSCHCETQVHFLINTGPAFVGICPQITLEKKSSYYVKK